MPATPIQDSLYAEFRSSGTGERLDTLITLANTKRAFEILDGVDDIATKFAEALVDVEIPFPSDREAASPTEAVDKATDRAHGMALLVYSWVRNAVETWGPADHSHE